MAVVSLLTLTIIRADASTLEVEGLTGGSLSLSLEALATAAEVSGSVAWARATAGLASWEASAECIAAPGSATYTGIRDIKRAQERVTVAMDSGTGVTYLGGAYVSSFERGNALGSAAAFSFRLTPAGSDAEAGPGEPALSVFGAPTLSLAGTGSGTVDLSWTTVPGATSYTVYYGTASGTYTTSAAVGDVTAHTVSGLTDGSPYYFAVTATLENGMATTIESAKSNEVRATPTAGIAGELVLLSTNITATEGASVSSWPDAGTGAHTVTKTGTGTAVYRDGDPAGVTPGPNGLPFVEVASTAQFDYTLASDLPVNFGALFVVRLDTLHTGVWEKVGGVGTLRLYTWTALGTTTLRVNFGTERTGSGSLTAGEWTCIGVYRDGSGNTTLYRNGASVYAGVAGSAVARSFQINSVWPAAGNQAWAAHVVLRAPTHADFLATQTELMTMYGL